MTDEPTAEWAKGKNIPKDAVSYWGRCKKCAQMAFVSPINHTCTECIFPPSGEGPVSRLPKNSDEPKNRDKPEPKKVRKKPKTVSKKTSKKTPKRKTSKKKTSEPWEFDETKKMWVIKNDKGRIIKQSKDKPRGAKK